MSSPTEEYLLNRVHKCLRCKASYTKAHNLYAHIRSRHPEAYNGFCKKCGDRCFSERALAIHMKEAHSKRCVCLTCNRDFNTKRGLTSHIHNKHPEKCSIFCNKCDYKCLSPKSLSMHKKRMHILMEEDISPAAEVNGEVKDMDASTPTSAFDNQDPSNVFVEMIMLMKTFSSRLEEFFQARQACSTD